MSIQVYEGDGDRPLVIQSIPQQWWYSKDHMQIFNAANEAERDIARKQLEKGRTHVILAPKGAPLYAKSMADATEMVKELLKTDRGVRAVEIEKWLEEPHWDLNPGTSGMMIVEQPEDQTATFLRDLGKLLAEGKSPLISANINGTVYGTRLITEIIEDGLVFTVEWELRPYTEWAFGE